MTKRRRHQSHARLQKESCDAGEHYFGCNTGETVQKPEVHGLVRRDEGVPSESRRHGCSSTQMDRQRLNTLER